MSGTLHPNQKKDETYYLMEARNGMLVRVPASKLDSWLAAQKEGPKPLSEEEKASVQRIVEKIYGPKADTAEPLTPKSDNMPVHIVENSSTVSKKATPPAPIYKKNVWYYLRKLLNPVYWIFQIYRWFKRLTFSPLQKDVYRGVLTTVRIYEAVMPCSTGFSFLENIKGELMQFLPKHRDLAFWMRSTFITENTASYNAETQAHVHYTLDSIICAVTYRQLLLEFRETVSRYGTTANWIRPDLFTLKQHIEETQKRLLSFNATCPDDCESVSEYLTDVLQDDFPFPELKL